MKRFMFVMMLVAIGMVVIQTQQASSADPIWDSNLIGSWQITQNATDPSGKPCLYVPETFVFYKDQTLTMTPFGEQRILYKTAATPEERQEIENRVPELNGQKLLLIRPGRKLDWAKSPMIYAYSVDKDELTLTIHGYSPAKFERVKK